MTMTHSGKVPYGHECWGHDPLEKESLKHVCLAGAKAEARKTLCYTVKRQCAESVGNVFKRRVL